MNRRSILTGSEQPPIVRGTKEELDARHQERTKQTAAVDNLGETLQKILRERAEQRGRERLEAEQPPAPGGSGDDT